MEFNSGFKGLRNIGIINSTTRLHLVGSVYEIYITIHGSMNIKSYYQYTKIRATNYNVTIRGDYRYCAKDTKY